MTVLAWILGGIVAGGAVVGAAREWVHRSAAARHNGPYRGPR